MPILPPQISRTSFNTDATSAAEDQLYSSILGDADWLPQTRNVLVTYGYISYINGAHPSPNPSAWDATMVRIIEYTHDPIPEVVFDLSFWDYGNMNSNYRGYFCYRSDRIADLYPHQPAPVSDLSVTFENAAPVLEFSADPARNYSIEASTDLKNWTNIGAPVAENGAGEFYFVDFSATETRFYRVITH